MASAQQHLEPAAALIHQARSQETADGNPLVAARCYTTAIEHISVAAAARAYGITDAGQRKFFVFQVRSRLEVYHERASLLLRTALEMGMLDKPAQSGGNANNTNNNSNGGGYYGNPQAALPAPNYNSGDNNNGNNGNNGSDAPPTHSNKAVMGIPIQSPYGNTSQNSNNNNNNNSNNNGGEDGSGGSNYYYLSQNASAGVDAPPPPPPIDSDELDALFK